MIATPVRDIAKVIRSKNAGPFEITLDIVFKTREVFEAVKKKKKKKKKKTPLREIAKVIRSKNAGPFEITLDIVFKTRRTSRR